MNAHLLDYGIVTHDRKKAERQLDKLVSKMIQGGEEILAVSKSTTDIFATFKSGKCVKWINPSFKARGYRVHGAYVDEELRDSEEFVEAVMVKADGYNTNGIYWFR